MATLYRSIWASDDPDAVDVADRSVVAWAEGVAVRHHRPLPSGTARTRASEQHRFVLRRDVHDDPDDTKIDKAVRLVFVESHRDGNRWTTTVRAWSGGSAVGEGAKAWVWIDVEADARDVTEPLFAKPPAFVADLLTTTAAAHGGVSLLPRAVRYRGDDGAEDLAGVLTLAERELPVVVFGGLGPDAGEDAVRVFDAAVQRTTRDVAGLATVAVLDAAGLDTLGAALGEGFEVHRGAMRLYLPALDPAADAPTRHLEIRAERFRDRPALAGRIAVNQLAPPSSLRRAPDSWDRAARRLDEVTPGGMVEKVARESARVTDLESELVAERRVAEEVLEEFGDLQHEVTDLRDRLAVATAELARLRGERTEEGLEDIDLAPPHARDCSDAAALARKHLATYLELPTEAGVDLELLDRQAAGPAWGEQAWRALRALAYYSRARSRDGYDGDFFGWCWNSRHPMAWPANPRKLAMRESKTVMERWPESRTFTVDGGEQAVQSHIKISSAGMAPRIYFTWVERTAKVHVAYFGRHLRNTRS
ncbi:MAG TPA: hypothetical protein VGH76_06455 [Actinomycetospora sp.]|jgi:hypothetical protein|uniref:hypothetical protein n=1 Tax=Actinomycetospora sp. TaxID=1872135 RepID=UPI002F3EE9E8